MNVDMKAKSFLTFVGIQSVEHVTGFHLPDDDITVVAAGRHQAWLRLPTVITLHIIVLSARIIEVYGQDIFFVLLVPNLWRQVFFSVNKSQHLRNRKLQSTTAADVTH